VWIKADGAVIVNGTISANGNDVNAIQFAGGGSGGGIYIECNTINGTGGVITAHGGLKGSRIENGGGGGGRIAIQYNAAAQGNIAPRPAIAISASGRENHYAVGGLADPGSLYLTDTCLLPELCNTASIHDVALFGFAAWSPDYLTVTNAWIMFSGSNFVLTVSNDLRIAGSAGRVDCLNGTPVVNVGGSLFMDGGATMHLYSGETNGIQTNCGGRVTVGGTLALGSSSWIYPYSHPTNGGSILFQVRDLAIATNAGFNANYLGFRFLSGAGNGLGPGGPVRVNAYSQGAGHGGKGGNADVGNVGGTTYGDSNAPVQAGSSGVHGQPVTSCNYGHGGGVVRIEAGNSAQVDGTITANGKSTTGQFAGGGSGGSVFIRCKSFSGGPTGILRANGGSKGSDFRNGSGAGGRIAVWRCYDSWQGTTSVTNGLADTNYPANWGAMGTIVWIDIPKAGTILTIR
jgi:hypothetical protein